MKRDFEWGALTDFTSAASRSVRVPCGGHAAPALRSFALHCPQAPSTTITVVVRQVDHTKHATSLHPLEHADHTKSALGDGEPDAEGRPHVTASAAEVRLPSLAQRYAPAALLPPPPIASITTPTIPISIRLSQCRPTASAPPSASAAPTRPPRPTRSRRQRALCTSRRRRRRACTCLLRGNSSAKEGRKEVG